mmetsp:Transcript_73352/g.218971  ORF Transcript_73352/g.218971 Transcript_73352/m.218971 type:complete len:285 (-) Transcript_73352:541-1395(-)
MVLLESLVTSPCTRSRCARIWEISSSLVASACSNLALSVFAAWICSRNLLPSACMLWSCSAIWPAFPSASDSCSLSAASSAVDSKNLSLNLLTSLAMRPRCWRTLSCAPSAAATCSSSSATLAFHVEICCSTPSVSSWNNFTWSSIATRPSFMPWTLFIRAIFSFSVSTTRVVSRATSPVIRARFFMSFARSSSPASSSSFSWALSSSMAAMRSSRSFCSDSTDATRCRSLSAVWAMLSRLAATSAFSCSATMTFSVRFSTSFRIMSRWVRSLFFWSSATLNLT